MELKEIFVLNFVKAKDFLNLKNMAFIAKVERINGNIYAPRPHNLHFLLLPLTFTSQTSFSNTLP